MAKFTSSDLVADVAESRLQREAGLEGMLPHDVTTTARLNPAYVGRVVPLVNRHAMLYDDLQATEAACTDGLEVAAATLVKGGKVADLSTLGEQQARLPVLRTALRLVAEGIKPTPAELKAARTADRIHYLERDRTAYAARLERIDGEIDTLAARARGDAGENMPPSPIFHERLEDLVRQRRSTEASLTGVVSQLVALGAPV